MDAPAQYRPYLLQRRGQDPALFPTDMAQGCTLPDASMSGKPALRIRRITVQAPRAVCALPPAFGMPSMRARPAEVAQARSLRPWGGPLDALASVLGRDAMVWYRAWRAFGRPALLRPTVTPPQQRPTDLVADEQGTWGAGQEVYGPTTGGGGGCLGGRRVAAAATAALETGDGELAPAARACVPPYQPRSVCPDGWHATREAGRRLGPQSPRGLCVLHAVLQRQDRGPGALRHHGLAKAWWA